MVNLVILVHMDLNIIFSVLSGLDDDDILLLNPVR